MATMNGGPFIREQLASFEAQTYPHWQLWISDDGSADATLELAHWWCAKAGAGRSTVINGPRQGFSKNFLSLACRPDLDGTLFAFSDQDDTWEADKLERAIAWHTLVPSDVPALYCGRTQFVDVAGRPIGYSPLFSRPPAFENALVQNIAGGNTMVFNQAARHLLQAIGDEVSIVSHDWWLYLLVSGAGGHIFYDPEPAVRYRQHATNLVGRNTGWKARLQRLRRLQAGEFRQWNDRHVAALQFARRFLTTDNRKCLDRFASARQATLITRLRGLKDCGVYRQSLLSDLALFGAAVTNRL